MRFIPKSKIGKIAVWLVIGSMALAFCLLNYRERNSYYCQTCWSRKDVYQWRVGLWMEGSIPLTPSWERSTQTQIQMDFFPSNHIHHWEFAQGSPYYFFGTTWSGCAIGAGRHVNQLGAIYNSRADFRQFVKNQIRSGTLTSSNFIAMASLPDSSEITNGEGQRLLDAYFNQK